MRTSIQDREKGVDVVDDPRGAGARGDDGSRGSRPLRLAGRLAFGVGLFFLLLAVLIVALWATPSI